MTDSKRLLKVTIEKPWPKVLISTEEKLRTWLGSRVFDKLWEDGFIEEINEEESEDDTNYGRYRGYVG
jgi:hypothetical protein